MRDGSILNCMMNYFISSSVLYFFKFIVIIVVPETG